MKQRERGFYVDYRKGIRLPSQIGEQAARRQIKVTSSALALAEERLAIDNLDDMLAMAHGLLDGIRGADPDAIAAAAQQAMQGNQDALRALLARQSGQA